MFGCSGVMLPSEQIALLLLDASVVQMSLSEWIVQADSGCSEFYLALQMVTLMYWN